MDNQPTLTPEQKANVKKAKIILWLGLGGIMLVGLITVCYFVFVPKVQAPTINKTTNASAQSDADDEEKVPVDESSWTSYDFDYETNSFFQNTNNGIRTIATPFSLEEYNTEITPYGAFFWKIGPTQSVSLPGFSDQVEYEMGIEPEMQRYDYTTGQFTALPAFNLAAGQQKFERIFGIYPSNSEKKIAFEIGEFDTRGKNFEPGMYESQPEKTHGVVYDVASNAFIAGDPVTAFLGVMDATSTLVLGFNWDSLNNMGVSVPGGEGCGNYDTLTFIDLAKKTKTTAGGPGYKTFAATSSENPCNPSNASSPDGHWFVLLGKSATGKLDAYLYQSATGNTPVRQKLNIEYEASEASGLMPYGIDSWDVSQTWPILTLDNEQQIDFN